MPITVSIWRPADPSFPRSRPTWTSTERVSTWRSRPHTRSRSRSRERTRFRFSTRKRRSSNSRFVSRTDAPDTRTETASKSIARLTALVGLRLIGRRNLLRSPQDGADPRNKLAQAERLCHVIVGAELEPGNTVGLAGSGRHHDDRNGGARRPPSQQTAHLQTIDERQVQIEQHETRAAPP